MEDANKISQLHLELLVESIDSLVVGKLIKDNKVIIAYTYILESSYIFFVLFHLSITFSIT